MVQEVSQSEIYLNEASKKVWIKTEHMAVKACSNEKH